MITINAATIAPKNGTIVGVTLLIEVLPAPQPVNRHVPTANQKDGHREKQHEHEAHDRNIFCDARIKLANKVVHSQMGVVKEFNAETLDTKKNRLDQSKCGLV